MSLHTLMRTLIGCWLTFVLVDGAKGQTSVSGTISTSTTWTLANSPYVVTGTVTVDGATNPVLTIQPGVSVKFNSGTGLVIGLSGGNTGALQANGTSSQPITFTANTASPTPGFWQGVYFQNCAGSSSLSYATVQYGGSNSLFRAGLQVATTCSPSLSNLTVQNNALVGAWISGGAPVIATSTFSANPVGMSVSSPGAPTLQTVTLSGNSGVGLAIGAGAAATLQTVTISGNTGFAMQLDASATLAPVTGLTLSGNGTNAAQLLSSGNVTASTTWRALGYPYNVAALVNVSGASSPVLTIEPDTVLRFDSGDGLQIGSGAGLQAVGSPGHLITFTSSSATPAPGSWASLGFSAGALASSHVSYAVVSYANYVNINAAVTIDNTTIQSCYQGISAAQSSSAMSLTNVTLTANQGAAVKITPNVTFGGISGLVVTGNGMDAVNVVGGTVDVSTRWKNVGLPYVVSGNVTVSGPLATSPVPVLTIDPLVTVKCNSTIYLQTGSPYAGRLVATGTAAQPVVFTANTSTPTPGFWGGIRIQLEGASSSSLSYATIAYATTAVIVSSGTPALDHVALTNNSQRGVQSSANPTVHSCSFVGNGMGGMYGVGDARLNWWNAASGPSGSGPGTGQAVTNGALYEPWLTAAPSTPQYMSTVTITNPTFNPAQSIYATTALTTPLSGNWTVTVTNSAQVQVRQFAGTGASFAPVWDGKDATGVDQPNGTYTYVAQSTSGSYSASPAQGRLTIDRTHGLAVSGMALDNAYFSPNGDGVKDTATVSGTANYTVSWTTLVKNSSGTAVRTLSGTGTQVVSTWNGRSDAGALQPEGAYTLNTSATAGTATVTDVRTTTLDITFPVGGVTSPAPGITVSNIYANGVTAVPVIGTATDSNLQNWTLDYGSGSSPTIWYPFTSGTAGVSGAQLGASWATVGLSSGLYSLRLTVADLAGNKTVVTRQVTVGNFNLIASASSFNAASGQTMFLQSIVPFTVTETLVFKNLSGTVVRTLVSGSRNAGNYNDTWNGRNQSGALLSDDAYLFSATITAGTYTLTWDDSATYLTGFQYMYPPLVNFDPFNNNPLPISYNFSQTGRVTIVFDRPGTGLIQHDCNAPRFCLVNAKYEEPGAHTVYWTGTDSTGAIRGDLTRVSVSTDQYRFSKNTIVVFGSKPTITNLRLTPPYVGPAQGTQNITFTLGTYQNQAVSIAVQILNQESLSVLRNISVGSQAPGAVTITWDGRADNGMMVAPGYYTITVTATDSVGNAVSGRTLATVQY